MRNTTPDLTPDEATFIRRLNDAYAPPPMGEAEQAAFDRRLRARLARRSRVRPPLYVAASAAVATLLWVVMVRPGSIAVPPQTTVAATVDEQPTEMEEILSVYDWATGDSTDLAMVLPADYQALAADYLGEWPGHAPQPTQQRTPTAPLERRRP